MFFNELNETLSKEVNSYEYIVVIGHLNIDVCDPGKDIYLTIYLTLLTHSHYQIC